MISGKYDPLEEYQKNYLMDILEPKITENTTELIYLNTELLEEFFLKKIKNAFDVDYHFARVWAHYTKLGGDRPEHFHCNDTFLYYLSIPPGECGNLVYNGIEVEPKEGMMYIIEAGTFHSVKPNHSKGVRWAIAAECIKP